MKVPFYLAALLHTVSLLSMAREMHRVETNASIRPILTIQNETSQDVIVTTTSAGRATTSTLRAGNQLEMNSPESLENLEIVQRRILGNTTIKPYKQLKAELSQARALKKNLLLELTPSSSWRTPLCATYVYSERHKDATEEPKNLDDLFPLAKAARDAQKRDTTALLFQPA